MSAEITTILFTDVVQSTEVLQRLGDERAQDVFRKHHRILSEAIVAIGGAELQWLGDGLVAAFSSVSDAIACALAMQEATRRQVGESRLRIRIGINTGEFLRDDAGHGYFGIPVVTARRLCDRAAPGTILCGSTVAGMLVGRQEYHFRDLGPIVLKGIAEPVHVYEALVGVAAAHKDVGVPTRIGAESGPAPPLPPLLAGTDQFPFTGRRHELDLLTALWREAANGAKPVALIEGEPGIGKTRLAAEAAHCAHASGGIVLFGRCDEEMGVPFQPFVEALEQYLAHNVDSDLRNRLGPHAGELARLVPDLVYRVPQLPPTIESDPETARYRLFDAVAGWLAAASQARPILLVLDDLHWAGSPTLLLLRHIARAVDAARLLIIGTHRDTEVGRTHPLAGLIADLGAVRRLERLQLHGLDENSIIELMEPVAGRVLDEVARALAHMVHTETSGNPFFVREVLRHLAESGVIAQLSEHHLSPPNLRDAGIPSAVRDVVLRRVNRLSPDAVQALTLAAVIGRDFELGTLAEVSAVADEDLVTALEEASAARLVEEAGTDTWRFAHALVRSALYDTLSASRRARLHRRAAQAIEARRPDDVTALAYHYAEAGPEMLGKAIEYSIDAGDQAGVQLAHHQAVYFYERAIATITAARRLDETRRCEVLIRLGVAQKHAGDGAHRDTLLEAAWLASSLGDTDRLVRSALENNRGWASRSGAIDSERVAALEAALVALDEADGAPRAMLLATLAAELLFGGDRKRRIALSDAALAMARRIGDLATLAHVLNVRSHVIWAPDTLAERLANTAEHVVVAQQLNDPVALWYAAATRLQACMEAGDLREVDENLQTVARLTAELGQPHQRWAATIDFAWRALLRGDVADAEKLATQAYEIGAASGQHDALVYYAGQLLAVRWDQGRLGELIPVLEQAVSHNPGIPAFGASLALAYSEVGRVEDAERILEGAATAGFDDLPLDMGWLFGMAAYAEVAARVDAAAPAALLYERLSPWPDHVIFGGLYVFGSVSRPLGLLATTLDRLADADCHFARAVAVHERLEAAALLARTRLDWATTLLARNGRGDVARARELLGKAVDAAVQLDLTRIAERAAALLER